MESLMNEADASLRSRIEDQLWPSRFLPMPKSGKRRKGGNMATQKAYQLFILTMEGQVSSITR